MNSNFETAKNAISAKLAELYNDKGNAAIDAVRSVTQYVRDSLKVLTEDEVEGGKRHFITSKEAATQIRPIDFDIIQEAILHLENEFYERIELPWDVPSKYVTRGWGDFAPNRRLVDNPAAAFQFMIDEKMITPGDYFAVTPVFAPVKKDKFSQQYGMSISVFTYQGANVKTITEDVTPFIRRYVKVYPENGNLVDGDGNVISTFKNHGKFIHGNIIQEPYFSGVALNIRAFEKKDVHD